MRLSKIIAAFSIGAECFFATASTTTKRLSGSEQSAVVENSVISGAYIVELVDDQTPDSFINSLQHVEGIGNVSQRLNLKSSLFNGVSLYITSDENEVEGDERKKISDLPQVKKVWPVELVSLQKPEIVWTGQNDNLPTRIKARRDRSTAFPPHAMTQLDKLRAEGYSGGGLRIGIIDSGIDYTHPALGGCFGSGCLVAYGTDLVGDDYNGTSAPLPDADPFSECEGHGTHVAGIIAAMENPLGFTGASPNVTLGMYRVFSCGGYSSTDIMIAAVTQAFEDGSDIITGSIGTPSGWNEHPFAVAVSRIVDAGVPCTFAIGNENGASYGVFSPSSPSSGKGVMAVGSFQSTDIPNLNESAGEVTYSPDTNMGGFVSDFTSWGPTFEIETKPQFGAPGGNILSTWPVSQGSYAVLSGTSMATPLTASIVALISQVRGTRDPKLIETVIASTAKPNLALSEERGFAPVVQQGAGLIQAYDAAHSTTLLSVSSLSFNDTDNFAPERQFTITNSGTSAATYNLSHVPALSAETLSDIYRSSSPELHTDHATLTLSPSTLTLAPGASAEILVTCFPPTTLDPATLPVYSGYIALNGTTSTNTTTIALSLPYIGVAGRLRNATVLPASRLSFTRSDDPLSAPVAPNTTFQLRVPSTHPEWTAATLPPTNDTTNTTAMILAPGALPTTFLWLLLGSPEVRLEAIPLDSSTIVAAETAIRGSLGNVDGYPMLYARPIGWMSAWDGKLADGAWAPPGRYRLSAAARKIMADGAEEADWDRYDTPAFVVRYVEAV